MFNSRFKSLKDLQDAFPTEQHCIDYLEEKRWGGKVVSPFDPTSKVYKCKDNKYRCKNTGKYFNVKTKLIFHKTSLPLIYWFMAIWLVLSHKKGISSIQLSKDIGVTQKTAWFMLHRIRKALGIDNDKSDDNNEDNRKLEGTVEVDETFIGGKNKNRHADKKVKACQGRSFKDKVDKKVKACQGRSFKDKVPVFGMLQRGGKVIAKVVSDTKAETLFSSICKYVKSGSNLYTDEWNYSRGADIWYNHRNVNHGAGFYGSGDLTTNHIEGFWALVKRSIMGIYYHWSKKHMQRYIDECVYRFNTRKFSDRERFDFFLRNIECRLTYKELIYG